MRTYTRKRPEYHEIEGVAELCRLCLGKAEGAVPIFAGDCDTVCAPLPLRIMICVGLEMTREDCLPNTICRDCYKELERHYSFRKKCEVTYQKLKSHMLAVKEKEYNKSMAMKIECQGGETGQGAEAPQQHLLLTIGEDQHVELVNVAGLDSVQLNSLQDLSNIKVGELKEDTREQLQDVTTRSPTSDDPTIISDVPTVTSDLSLIMTTMLVELGVMRQEKHGLVLVDESLRTVELEGEDNTRIVLRLMEEEEEEEEQASNETVEESPNIPIAPKVVTKSVENNNEYEDILPIPQKMSFDNKESAVKNKESAPPPLRCSLCGKRFLSRSALSRHARAHSGERPHACRVCARRFLQRAVMLRHELVHAENRPFKCSECPKSFTQRGALEAHARRHRPTLALHRCHLCDKVFLYPSGLSRHTAAAHGGRWFACGACARPFRDRSSLRRHAARAHPAPAPPAPAPA